MGYCVQLSWDLRFHNEEGVLAAAEALAPILQYDHYTARIDEMTPRQTIMAAVAECNGDSSEEEWSADPMALQFFGYGKYYDDTFNSVAAILAPFVVGTVDGDTEDDDYYRIRFYGDGTIREFAGQIVYLNDSVTKKEES